MRFIESSRATPQYEAAEAVAPSRRQHLKDNGIVRVSTNHPCVQKLWSRCYGRCASYLCHPPATDHPYLLKVDGKLKYFVSEPYGYSVDDQVVREMLAYADAYSLQFSIRPEWATHFPGRTMAILWSRRD